MAAEVRAAADNVAAIAFAALEHLPKRHLRERLYRSLEIGGSIGRATADSIFVLRQRFGDEGMTEVVTCACGQKNRVNLRSTHDHEVGPRCGRCKAALS